MIYPCFFLFALQYMISLLLFYSFLMICVLNKRFQSYQRFITPLAGVAIC